MLSWQRHDRCLFLPFTMYISSAKFEEHCFNISRDILDWVLYCFSGTTYDVITFLIYITWKSRYPKNEKRYSWLWKAFQLSSNYFLVHRHFNTLQSRMFCVKSVGTEVDFWEKMHLKFLTRYIKHLTATLFPGPFGLRVPRLQASEKALGTRLHLTSQGVGGGGRLQVAY